ncbi:hypothetical protein FNH22_17165 [Fulvivirga sp. M361]|uniref:AidA/PixA family protein n=1 Tax=Fulvivirga sp. M361 TaxID=2594266 RepID=UPI00117B275A|nr:AidA/PixA family protein [Fulvivirga sp. M361]TRX56109.1 hypothetical protein FNH22_17165 [Fulvivirga sp. M361]
MADINVLIVVDTKTTLAGTTTVYMEDDNPGDDTGEGTSELHINASPGDKIIWRATSINQSDTIDLSEFVDNSGQVFSPAPTKNTSDGSWSGTVGNFPADTTESYTFRFKINGGSQKYSWDPEIKIKT